MARPLRDLASLSAEWCRNINSALISFELYYFCLSARVASHKTKVYLKLAMFEVNSAMDEGRRLGGEHKRGVCVCMISAVAYTEFSLYSAA